MKEKLNLLGTILLIFFLGPPLILLSLAVFGFLLFHLLLAFGVDVTITQTNQIADYSNITGNYNNEAPKEFIFRFFPETIEDSFSDVTYHYFARKFDAYGYEVYLEFTIEDPQEFWEFLADHVPADETRPFSYDEAFTEYTISNILWSSPWEAYPGDRSIESAEIGRILVCEEEQRFIFSAIGVHDGGATRASDLSYFTNRFGIDWVDYQNNAYATHQDQESGILYPQSKYYEPEDSP